MSMNEKVDIEIFKRKLTVEIEGMTPMEISGLAQLVSDKMHEVANQNTKIADSSKLAILTALSFAVEHSKASAAYDTQMRAIEHKIEELTLALQSALAAK